MLEDLTPAQIQAYIIADNKLAENAGWDMPVLKAELEGLLGDGFDLSLTGFSDAEIGDILNTNFDTQGLTDPDHAPEAPQTPCSREGDVWLLGSHRLVCGDCTTLEAVERCFGGVKPSLMVTDPPYGVEYDADWRNHAARTSPGMGNRAIGAGATGKVENDNQADWREAWRLFPGPVGYVWHAGTKAHVVAQSLIATGFNIRAQIIWVKNRFAIGRGHYHHQHEPVFHVEHPTEEGATHETGHYAVRDGSSAGWKGDRKQSTVWFIEAPKISTNHSTQKPVECMERPIRNNSSPGAGVYDPFCGSGTTLIACQRTGRICYAIEINPVYVDVAVKRWQEYTGKVAELESSREPFGKVAAKRHGEVSDAEG